MGWVEFKNGEKFRLLDKGNKFIIEVQKDNSAQEFIYHTQPFTLSQNEQNKYYKAFYDYARGIWTGEDLDFFSKYYKQFCQELIDKKITSDEIAKREDAKKKAQVENTQKSYERYYE